jgi:cytochrome c oxidase subunit 2
LFGKQESFQDGSTAEVTEAYLKESIRQPNAKVVRPFQPVMPLIPLTDEELQTVVDFIKTLK